MVTSCAVAVMELFPTDQRTFAGTFVEFAWTLGLVTLTPIAYFIRDWRSLVLALGLPHIITIVFYW